MAVHQKFRLGRVVAAIFVAELLPILLLVAVVTVYALTANQSKPDSLEPEAFAPIAGNWVGPMRLYGDAAFVVLGGSSCS